jgi:prophage regulatory protein
MADTGLSRSGLYRELKTGRLPPPVKLSESAVAWPSDEIDRWIAARIAERNSAIAAAATEQQGGAA